MILRELYYFFKSNKLVIVTSIFQISIFFILLGTFLSFSNEVMNGKNNIEKIYKNKAIYQLLDGYFNPDEFTEFRERENSLDILKNYYNELNSASSFQYLSMFNQKLFTDDLKGVFPDIQMMEGRTTKVLDSFQINKQAYDYFTLSIVEGRQLSSEDFLDRGEIVPVIIGSNYKKYLAVGDTFEAIYYQKEVLLEVVGILQPDTFLYFNGDPEFYLDNSIIIPYVNYNNPKTEFEQWFQKIVYFAMINGYISIPIGDDFTNNMKEELEVIAHRSGFYNYLFIGSNPNTQPYIGLINVINSNYDLVKLLFYFLFFLNVVTICLQMCLIQKKRLPSLAVHYLHGASLSYLIKQFSCEVITTIVLAFVLSQIGLRYVLMIFDPRALILLSIVGIFLTLFISVFPIYMLIKFDLVSLINNEEEHSCYI